MHQSMVKVENLWFSYDAKPVLHGVSCSIKAGSVVAVIGPNGAGKTTFLRCLAGLETPDRGQILIGEHNMIRYPRKTRAFVGFLQDLFGLYDTLTIHQLLDHAAQMRRVHPSKKSLYAKTAIERLHLGPLAERKIQTLSRGQRQRAAIAAAIIHQPPLLLLDEPAAGLDPEARSDLSDLLQTLSKEGMTILVSSHILTELDQYATDILIVQKGSFSLYDSIMSLKPKYRFDLLHPCENFGDLAQEVGIKAWKENNAWLIEDTPSETRAKLLAHLIDAGIMVCTLSPEHGGIESIYRKTLEDPE